MDDISRAVALLRDGSLIALPTETVYGLAGDAENPAAVSSVFALKGRPASHPLIVHLASASQLGQGWAERVPDGARRLAAAFWPGPLTLVLERGRRVSDQVTGGQETVAVRVPSHALTQAVLHEFGSGLVMPSANRFGRVSATTAAAVREEFGGELAILDGGACAIGLESTIVDCTRDDPAVLRPGAINCEELSRVLGRPVHFAIGEGPRVSGSLASHYAPRATVEIVTREDAPGRIAALRATGAHVVWTAGNDPAAFAHNLYEALRDADRRGADIILVSPPGGGAIGPAIDDRLRRACAPRARQTF